MKNLNIGIISHLVKKVPPVKYGGVELVVYNLVEELVKRGHNVTLFASGDSETSAKLVSPFPTSISKAGEGVNPEAPRVHSYGQVLKRQKDFDIIHNHTGWRFLPFSVVVDTSLLHTYHTYFYERTKFIFKAYKDQPFTFLSKSHERQAPFLNSKGAVYNGITVKNFKFNDNPQDHFIWIGRFSDTKGAHEAIKAALEADVKLVLAGKLETIKEKKYFKEKVEPFLENEKISYIGEITRKEKSNFFGSAKGLLNPIKWEEPFGLVMTEAMVCGTPVIAFNRGSAPELIKDKETGFIVENVEEMTEAIKKIDKISRKKCRERVEKNFSVSKMVDDYEKIYKELI